MPTRRIDRTQLTQKAFVSIHEVGLDLSWVRVRPDTAGRVFLTDSSVPNSETNMGDLETALENVRQQTDLVTPTCLR
jgi:hypothetical protein